MQTLLSKQLGPIGNWHMFISQQQRLNYNAFHFTPLQQLGKSKSLYSIADQLSLDPFYFSPQNLSSSERYVQLKDTLSHIKQQNNCLFFVDILLNHTSSDSLWLNDDHDAYYSLVNSPHLNSAFVLDQFLNDFSVRIVKGQISQFPQNNVSSYEDVEKVIEIMKSEIHALNIHQYHQLSSQKFEQSIIDYQEKQTSEDKYKIKKVFSYLFAKSSEDNFSQNEISVSNSEDDCNLFSLKNADIMIKEFIQNNLIKEGESVNGVQIDFSDFNQFLDKVGNNMIQQDQIEVIIEQINRQQYQKVEQILEQAIKNIKSTIIHEKIQKKKEIISEENPLVQRYFTVLANGRAAANNGWIMDYNKQENFTQDKHSFYYLRRDIVIWEDLVRLNYQLNSKGKRSRLTKNMKRYIQNMSQIFDGIRLDNAHSTDLLVGEYMLKKARQMNPNLIVFAELFTGDAQIDAEYSRKLGINCLVRESQVNWSCSDYIKFGQIDRQSLGRLKDPYSEIEVIQTSHPQVLYYDLTHDNPSYQQYSTYQESLTRIALLSFLNCFQATTFGFDELYTQNVSVVDENRLYHIPMQRKDSCAMSVQEYMFVPIVFNYADNCQEVREIAVRGSWDDWQYDHYMHRQDDGYCQRYVVYVRLQIYQQYQYKFLINQHNWVCDQNQEVFGEHSNHQLKIQKDDKFQFYKKTHSNLREIRKQFNILNQKIGDKYPLIYMENLDYNVIQIIRENQKKGTFYTLIVRNNKQNYKEQQHNVNLQIQLPGYYVKTKYIVYSENTEQIFQENETDFGYVKGQFIESNQIREFCDIKIDKKKSCNILNFCKMNDFFVCVVKSKYNENIQTVKEKLNNLIKEQQSAEFEQQISDLKASEINFFLFQCEQEQIALQEEKGYQINSQSLIYQGLGGVYSQIKAALLNNNLGLPLFDNIRQGSWLMQYWVNRIYSQTQNSLYFLANHINDYSSLLYQLTPHDIPQYFSTLIITLFDKVRDTCFKRSHLQIKEVQQDPLIKLLNLSCYQFINSHLSFSAGLPHFCTGWSREWGRDTFISLRGGLLVPGLFKEARHQIVSYARALRHGLLPNLLDNANRPRYNCRDTVWWFIKALQDYLEFTNDYGIMSQKVQMVFLANTLLEHNQKARQQTVASTTNTSNGDLDSTGILTISEIVQQIFQSHSLGICFREWFGGFSIDENMSDQGFTVELRLDKDTGFIMGGNQYNCLTWMDKMGSSIKAMNKGVPATSRDGAPIEMTALLYRALRFVIGLDKKVFAFEYVRLTDNTLLYYKEWANRIERSFNTCYYIPMHCELDFNYHLQKNQIKRRGIYKDTYRSKHVQQEYQLRPNQAIAMAVAPQLFKKIEAIFALGQIELLLINKDSLGVKTLDPEDIDYTSYYDNTDNTYNSKTAGGQSYHQGPEWVWLYGVFLQAHLILNAPFSNHFYSYLSHHLRCLKGNWISLPEMTDGEGNTNRWSCPAQAWSVATILDAIHQYNQINTRNE